MKRHRNPLAAAVLATATLLSAGLTASAAPVTYETSVLASNPYVFYRANESSGTIAQDSSGSDRDGTYNGSPTFGVAGAGTLSDNAVSFPGTDGNFLSSSINSFGSLAGTSSYEFVFKVNEGFSTTTIQSLFGIYTSAANRPDINLDLNSRGNDNGGLQANTTRLFVRGNNADANGGASVAGHFVNENLYDGNYHHLVFTFDASTVDPDTDGTGEDTGSGGFRAYVDGVEQDIIFTQVNGTIAPAGFSDFDVPATFAARNIRTANLSNVTREANVTIDEASLYGSVLTPAQVAANFAATTIPEPTTLGLLGVAGLGLLRRRSR